MFRWTPPRSTQRCLQTTKVVKHRPSRLGENELTDSFVTKRIAETKLLEATSIKDQQKRSNLPQTLAGKKQGNPPKEVHKQNHQRIN